MVRERSEYYLTVPSTGSARDEGNLYEAESVIRLPGVV